jgi:hypothetical protein
MMAAGDVATADKMNEKLFTMAVVESVEKAEEMMEAWTADKAFREASRTQRTKQLESRYSTAMWLMLIELKYGKAIADEVEKKQMAGIPRLMGRQILKYLNAQQTAVVVKAYDTLVAESAVNCPHVKAVKGYRRNRGTPKAAESFKKMMAFAAAGSKSSDWIKCKECSGNLVCGHVVAMENADTRNVYKAIAPYLDKQTYGAYCKVCPTRTST